MVCCCSDSVSILGSLSMTDTFQRIEDRKLLDTYHDRACLACGARPSDPCHIRSRGAGGPDTPWNLVPLCRRHHTEQHTIGWDTMLRKYPKVFSELSRLGWHKQNGRMWNAELEAK